MERYPWLRRARVVFADQYWRPFYPHIEYEPERLIRAMKAVNANTIRFAAIGFWAGYPTTHFPVHPELGERDLLRETLEVAHREGLRLIAYVPLSTYTAPHTVRQRPEWLQRDLEGRYRVAIHTGKGQECWRICSHGPYRPRIQEIVAEIVRGYDVDGVYFDGPGEYYLPCYCPHCRASFQQRTGMDLPPIRDLASLDWADPLIRAYFRWVEDLDVELLDSLVRLIKGVRDVPVLAHGQSILHRPFVAPHCRLMEIVDGCLFETGTSFLHRLAVALLTVSTGKVMWSYTGTVNWHPRYWEHRKDFETEGFASLAIGGTVVCCTANKLYYDLRGAAHIRAVFDVQERHQELFAGVELVPFVALPYSQASAQWYGRHDPETRYNAGYRSAFVVLHDAHLQANPVLDDVLDDLGKLCRFPVVYLANLACLSDLQAANLRRYVEEGGTLLATGISSLYDEHGYRRPDFALADLFGVHYRGQSDVIYDAYLVVTREHPVTGGFGLREPLPQVQRTIVSADTATEELAESELGGQREGSALVTRTVGRGKVVYFAAPPEQCYFMEPIRRALPPKVYHRSPEVRQLVANAVQWLGGDRAPMGLVGHRGVTALLTRKQDLLILNLVNRTGEIVETPLSVLEEIVPRHDVRVGVRRPAGRTVRQVRLLVDGATPSYREDGDWVVVTVPRLAEFEAVVLELT